MDYLPVALRAYTQRTQREAKAKSPPRRRVFRPESVLVLDCETETEFSQHLTFGSARLYRCDWKHVPRTWACLRETLFYADELPLRDREGFGILREYASTRAADVSTHPEALEGLELLSRRDFVERVFMRLAYQARALVVGFNLPFDLSRLAVACSEARGEMFGGFSLSLSQWIREGQTREHRFRPRLRIKTINAKSRLISFGDTVRIDANEGSLGNPRVPFRGHFLDLRTLAFALTNESYTLERCCSDFSVEHGKGRASGHGVIDPAYIDYNRRDVLATFELCLKLLEEYDRHPISPHPTRGRA